MARGLRKRNAKVEGIKTSRDFLTRNSVVTAFGLKGPLSNSLY